MERKLIDAVALCEGRVSNDPVVIAAKCAPTIDAVEVVRCAQCVYYRPDHVKHCVISGMQIEDDDYCSHAERREPDGE